MSRIVSQSSKISTKNKRSEFISYLLPLQNTDDAAHQIKKLKLKNPVANHFCWAYRMMIDSDLVEYYSDAGEPSGTAGLPILRVMQKSDIVNSILVVVRIFGGIKLGRPRLITTYREAAQMVVDTADLITWLPTVKLSLSCQYEMVGDLSAVLNRLDLKPNSESSHNEIVWKIEVLARNEKKLTCDIISAMQGKVLIEKILE